MKTLTLRPNKEQQALIDYALSVSNEKTASKAIWWAISQHKIIAEDVSVVTWLSEHLDITKSYARYEVGLYGDETSCNDFKKKLISVPVVFDTDILGRVVYSRFSKQGEEYIRLDARARTGADYITSFVKLNDFDAKEHKIMIANMINQRNRGE